MKKQSLNERLIKRQLTEQEIEELEDQMDGENAERVMKLFETRPDLFETLEEHGKRMGVLK